MVIRQYIWCYIMPAKCICKYCGGSFKTYPSLIKKGGGKFCCPEHYHKWASENKIRSGSKCNLWKNAKVEVTCKQCGKVKLRYKSQIRWRGSGFCSKQCRILFYRADKHWAFNGYSSRLPYCPLWTPEFRENVREFYGHICVECEKTQYDNGEKLIVHHVNNRKDTLCKEGEEVKDRLFVVLCRSCHGKTIPKNRREYYKEKYTKLIMEEYNGRCYTIPETLS